jgi:hypothetical protein
MLSSSLRPVVARLAGRPACSQVAERLFASAVQKEEKAPGINVYEELRLASQEEMEAEKDPVQKHMEALTMVDPRMVGGNLAPIPDPVLPDNPSEIAALDPAMTNQDLPRPNDGSERMVHIRQELARKGQSARGRESNWIISFQDDGETADCWENPLMGWVSSADPLATNMKLQLADFKTASEAVYFAKKRGWKFTVAKPIIRLGRDDGALYQDNFLPQAVAGLVKREGKNCKHWQRDAAGTSHYFRPLKYHGEGLVPQHGPNPDAAIEKATEGYYKLR